MFPVSVGWTEGSTSEQMQALDDTYFLSLSLVASFQALTGCPLAVTSWLPHCRILRSAGLCCFQVAAAYSPNQSSFAPGSWLDSEKVCRLSELSDSPAFFNC